MILSKNSLALLGLFAVLFTWSCQCKHFTILTPRYLTEFDGYSFFQLNLILITSESTSLGDIEITNLVFSTLSEILLHSTNYSTVSYHSWPTYVDFSLTYLYERDLRHQQNHQFKTTIMSFRPDDLWERSEDIIKDVAFLLNLVREHRFVFVLDRYSV